MMMGLGQVLLRFSCVEGCLSRTALYTGAKVNCATARFASTVLCFDNEGVRVATLSSVNTLYN